MSKFIEVTNGSEKMLINTSAIAYISPDYSGKTIIILAGSNLEKRIIANESYHIIEEMIMSE